MRVKIGDYVTLKIKVTAGSRCAQTGAHRSKDGFVFIQGRVTGKGINLDLEDYLEVDGIKYACEHVYGVHVFQFKELQMP